MTSSRENCDGGKYFLQYHYGKVRGQDKKRKKKQRQCNCSKEWLCQMSREEEYPKTFLKTFFLQFNEMLPCLQVSASFVEEEIFTGDKFSWVAWSTKTKHTKICLWWVIRATKNSHVAWTTKIKWNKNLTPGIFLSKNFHAYGIACLFQIVLIGILLLL